METTLLLVTLIVLQGAGLVLLVYLRARGASHVAALFTAITRDLNSLPTLNANVERLLADKSDAERADRFAASGWARRQAEGLVRAAEGAASRPDRPRLACFGGLYFSLDDVLYVDVDKLGDSSFVSVGFRTGRQLDFQHEKAEAVIDAFLRQVAPQRGDVNG